MRNINITRGQELVVDTRGEFQLINCFGIYWAIYGAWKNGVRSKVNVGSEAYIRRLWKKLA